MERDQHFDAADHPLITQIFTAVTDLSKMMEDSMSRLSSTNEAAATLREVADRVQQMVQSYRI
jgi:methyl-accepting chemotaxis protein